MNFILRAFIWWNSQTLNTQFFTWRKGICVGKDDDGNTYYRTKDDSRRWVIYNGESEASRVSPDWHGWLHRTWDVPPSEQQLKRKIWEKPHEENLTGSELAYAPSGSIRKKVPEIRQDYEAWQPD